jgi:hypothetical protein
MTWEYITVINCIFVALLCIIFFGGLFLYMSVACRLVINHIQSVRNKTIVKEAKPFLYWDQESGIGSDTISVADIGRND